MRTEKSEIQGGPGADAPPPLAWTVGQVADRLNLSQMTIKRLIQRNKLRRIDGLRRIIIPESSIREFAG